MTMMEILNSTADTLGPGDIAGVLGCDPQTLRLMAVQDPQALAPLQPIRLGNRVRFPRLRFIWWYYGEQHEAEHQKVNPPRIPTKKEMP